MLKRINGSSDHLPRIFVLSLIAYFLMTSFAFAMENGISNEDKRALYENLLTSFSTIENDGESQHETQDEPTVRSPQIFKKS